MYSFCEVGNRRNPRNIAPAVSHIPASIACLALASPCLPASAFPRNVVRFKIGVIKFFQRSGVPQIILTQRSDCVRRDRQSVRKSEIAREMFAAQGASIHRNATVPRDRQTHL